MNRFLFYLKILSILDIIFANKYDLIIYDKKGNKKTQTTFDEHNKKR